MKKALTIAGSDSGGGAGIQADLKTFAALRVYGASAITALTAQNTVGVEAVHVVPADFVLRQIEAVVKDIGADAVKTGMLANGEIIEAVAFAVQKWELDNLVIDPVMVAKSGDMLLAEEAAAVLKERLFPHALVVTPNLSEAAVLTGEKVETLDQMKMAARSIHLMGPEYVLVKGGHLESDEIVDLLYNGQRFDYFRADRVNTPNNHGTGCTFAAAMAAFLARGLSITDAVLKAQEYLQIALGSSLAPGGGCGPVHHLAPFYTEWD